MKLTDGKIILTFVILIVGLTAAGICLYWHLAYGQPTFEERERLTLGSLLFHYKQHNNYDTIVAHCSPFRTVIDSTHLQGPRGLYEKKSIGNYLVAVTLSDSTQSYNTFKEQANYIAETTFNDIIEQDTNVYRNVIVQMFDQQRDSIYLFRYKTNYLPRHTQIFADKQ